MGLPHQLAIVDMFQRLGVHVTLSITSEEVETLSVDDVAALVELGAGDAMLTELREVAGASQTGVLELDFEQQTVTDRDTLI